MGCWNQTCGVSNLHITAGQKVVVVPLFKQVHEKGETSLCYSNAVWAPYPVPFYSEYDDYGGGENSHGVGLELLMQTLREELVEMDVGENQYHDIAVKKDQMGEKLFFEAVHESRLFVKAYRGQSQVAFMMIHGDIFEHLLENFYTEHYYYDENDNFKKKKIYFKDVLADTLALVDTIKEKIADSKGGALPLRFALMSLRNGHGDKNCAAGFLSSGQHDHMPVYFDIASVLEVFAEAEDWAGMENFLTDFMKAKWLQTFMSMTRKMYTPQVGQGSQQNDTFPYECLIEGMQKVIAAEKAEYAEENDEDEDEPCSEALSSADEVIDALKARGYDYSKYRVEIALQLFDQGLLEGNDDVTTDLGDSELKDLRAIQEDHYDQHMDESEKPNFGEQVCYTVVVPSYVWVA